MSTFVDHPAFRADRPHLLRRDDLNDIRAVLPLHAGYACQAVYRAMCDERELQFALAALEAMPEPDRAHVLTMASAFASNRRRAA